MAADSAFRRVMPLALALFAADVVAGDGLGRLFSSAAERARLERLREAEAVAARQPLLPAVPTVVQPAAAEPAPAEAMSQRDLSGLVLRKDGTGTVWVDGAPTELGSPDAAAAGVRGLRPEADAVRFDLGGGRSMELKPGQRYRPVDDAVEEAMLAPAEPAP